MEFMGFFGHQVGFLILALMLSPAMTSKPNIVFILTDDQGYNDVSWNNGDIDTANLQTLADQGVILDSLYAGPLCSPSRASFMTGKYPYHLGLQHGIIKNREAKYLPDGIDTLPSLLRDAGYDTHMVGKWHLGFCDWDHTPTGRGFDSHGGTLCGAGNHYTHYTTDGGSGFDFRLNQTESHAYDGNHSTDAAASLAIERILAHDTNNPMFLYVAFQAPHSPLLVDAEYENLYSSITDENRRKFSGMVTHVDRAVKSIVDALNDTGMIDNLLLVYMSDNGGSTSKGGNNYPLRGEKGSLYEGGTRVPGFMYSSSLLSNASSNHTGMIHMIDWLPTLLESANISYNSSSIDGVSQWSSISQGETSARTEFVYNIDEVSDTAAIRVGSYKLYENPNKRNNGWYDVPSRRKRDVSDDNGAKHLRRRRQTSSYELYNLDDDPTETDDLSTTEVTKLAEMIALLDNYYKPTLVTALDPGNSAGAKPGGVWTPGFC